MRAASAALALASTAAALVALEVGAQLWLPPPRYHQVHRLIFDTELGFRGEPGARVEGFDAQSDFAVLFDEQGFRRRELPPPAGTEEPIALLGDSFVVAQGVRDADTLSSQLEARLAERGRMARVHDLAVVDYGTAQELLLWRAHGARLGARSAVLALYPTNDWANNTLSLAGRTQVSPGDYLRPYLVPTAQGSLERRFAHPARAELRSASRLFAMLEQRALSAGAALEIGWLQPWPPADPVELRLQSGRAPREELEIFRAPGPGSPWQDAWTTSEALLRALRDELQAAGTRLVVLVIPSLSQVQQEASEIRLDLLARQHAGVGLSELLDWNLPERRLAAFFARERIEAVLLLDAFREATGRGDSLYLSDGHLAAQGYALAAERLAAALASSETRAAPPLSAGPTPLLPPPDTAPAWLDFHAAAYQPFLVRGGWLTHQKMGTAAGWLIGARASLVLPARRGDLVLRGHVSPESPLPVSLRLRLGDALLRSQLATQGDFELRLPQPLADAAPRWVEVELELDAGARDRDAVEVYVDSIGFVAPLPASRPTESAPIASS